MTKTPKEYLKEPYSRILIPDDSSFAAEILEFPGCFAQGDTPNEAFASLEEAAELWIEAALEEGLEIPEPYMNQGYGGKIALRLPKSIHRQAARLADRDGVSLNQFLVSAISARVGAEDLYSHIIDGLNSRIPNRLSFSIMNQSMKANSMEKMTFSVLKDVSFSNILFNTHEAAEVAANQPNSIIWLSSSLIPN
jgi:predicted RNase H-like HicB family nuclease